MIMMEQSEAPHFFNMRNYKKGQRIILNSKKIQNEDYGVISGV